MPAEYGKKETPFTSDLYICIDTVMTIRMTRLQQQTEKPNVKILGSPQKQNSTYSTYHELIPMQSNTHTDAKI